MLLRWFGSLTAFLLMILLFKQQGWAEIKSAFQQVTWSSFLICSAMIFTSRFAVAGRWHVLLTAVGDITYIQSLRLTFAGLFATNFLPTTVGGDIVRLAGAKQCKLDVAVSTASLIMDRLVGMFGMAMALPFGVQSLYSWFSTTSVSWSGNLLGFSSPFFSQLFQKTSKFTSQIFQTFKLWSDHPASWLASIGFTFIHMLCFFGAIALLLDGMGEHLSLGLIGGLWSFVYFVTLIPISINSYGVQEVSMTLIFNQVGGISLDNSLAIAVLFRTLIVIGSVPGVLFVPGIIAGKKVGDHNYLL